jgi:hypothetical protein
MSTIDPLDTEQTPYRTLPTAEVKLTWVDNTTGVKELAFGTRLPSQRGYQREHDHGDKGGVHLGMPLERYVFGPYTRKRFDMYSGVPIVGSNPTNLIATGKAKLLLSAPCRVLGGVTGVHIDFLLVGQLAAAPQPLTLAFVLRPLGLVNFNSFLSSINDSAFTYGNMKKVALSVPLSITRQRATISDLSRLGPAHSLRQAELCVFLCSDILSGDYMHITSANVLVASTTTDVSPLSGPPPQAVTLSQVQAGQPLLAGLGEQAKQRGNALNLSVQGVRPGFWDNQINPSVPWVQELTGAHQHQGLKIKQADGSFLGDGPILGYSLFSQSYAQVGETSADEFVDNLPCTGIKVSRTGVIGQQLTFFQDFPLASGVKKIYLLFALRPETSSPKTRLAVAVHLTRANVTPTTTNNKIISCAGTPTVDAAGYVVGTAIPAPTAGHQPNGGREAAGLGLWTRDAEAAQAQSGVRLENCYRVSVPVEMVLLDEARATEQYTLRYQFLLYDDQTETALDDAAGLLWVNGIAVE